MLISVRRIVSYLLYNDEHYDHDHVQSNVAINIYICNINFAVAVADDYD